MWLTDLRLIDTSTGSVAECAIEVRDGVIARIVEDQAPDGVDTMSLGSAHVLPGLIACHTHLQGLYPFEKRDPNEPIDITEKRAANRARETLSAGITTVRCLHEQGAVDVLVRDRIARGELVGPRIFASGRALTVPGGHGDGLGCRVASGREGFRDAGRAELSGGAHQLKVFASGGLARAGESLDEPQMTLAEMEGAVAAADEGSTYVVAHAAASSSIERGIRAGIRSFEHAYRLDDVTAQMMVDARAFLTPTLVVTHSEDWMRQTGFTETAISRNLAAADQHLESAAKAIEAGVTIVAGTDFPPAERNDGVLLLVRELELLVDAGLDHLGALQAGTTNAARLLDAPELGRVTVGSPADLIATRDNPVEDIRALRDIVAVFQAGRVIRDNRSAAA